MKQLLTFACLVSIVLPAAASNPTLTLISPRGGERGAEVKLLFNGKNLVDAKELLAYSGSFEVTKLEVVNPTQVALAVKIKPDCPLGEHMLRLRCESGITEMRTFWVSPFPVIEEPKDRKKPRSDFSTPHPIPLNSTVHGVILPEGNDFYRVELKKGQRLSVEIEAMRLGGAFFDPYIAVLDSKRFELASSDDSPLFAQDGVLSLLAPEDGKYVIQVRETAFRGSGDSFYRLHVHTLPRPLGVMPLGGKPGTEMEVTFLGDASGPLKRKIKVPNKPLNSKDFVFAEEDGKTAPSGVPFRISDLPNAMAVKPNQTPETATRFAVPGAINGVVEKAGERDYFRFTAKKGETYDFRVFARQLGSTLDSVMTLTNDKGGQIANNDDTNGPDSYFRATIPADGDYFLTIRDHLLKGGPNYFYRVEVAAPRPHTEITTNKPVQYSQERQAIAVPRGNRFATLMLLTRTDWGGDLDIVSDGLPEKVKANAERVAASMTSVPVVYEAAADAPLGGHFFRPTAKPADAKQHANSDFHQTPELILGQNNVSFWSPRMNRAVLAVTKEVPFSVRIVEPKVPLVQNGSLNLKIVAERKGDFKGAITCVPLYNPPGVGAAGSVTIPEGQTEVFLPMNANGNAPVRKWSYVVQATANVGDGPVWVSSQLAFIEIAKPYVTLNMERGAVDQGKEAQIFVKLTANTPFEGKATVKLVGLPPKTAAADQQIDKATKECAFTVKTEPTSPAGIHKNIFCNVLITQNGETISQNLGYSELRIDVPIAAKNAPPAAPNKTAAPPANPAQPAKRLTRLEQLRLEQEQREKAAKDEKK